MNAWGLLLITFSGAAMAQTWDFEARLDGKPIGTHRFVVTGPADAREVRSTADFKVSLLGIPVYRYHHEAQERWQGDCLAELHSSTDDDGKPVRVDQQRPASECVMSFAYWHPALRQQKQLLNPQTGQMEGVRFEPLPDATLTVQGQEVPAARWRLLTTPGNGAPQDLTLWLARADGRWIGLDARVKGGRQLTYRLP